jgi:phosphoribosylformylglycinamidine synthase
MHGIGARVTVAGDPFVSLFSESTARAIVTCVDAAVDEFSALAADHDIVIARLGRCTGEVLVVDNQFEIPLGELRAAHEATLPTLFG